MQRTWWLSQQAITPYRGFCMWGLERYFAQGFRPGLPRLHTIHYLIYIMHQQALNIKLWMHAKIPRVVYGEKGHFTVQIICPLSVNQGVAGFCIIGPHM